MKRAFGYEQEPGTKTRLDPIFRPAILAIRNYLLEVHKTNDFDEVTIALERSNMEKSYYKTDVFSDRHGRFEDNCFYIERMIKSLLWLKGGYKIYFSGPRDLGEFVRETFSETGNRSFDAIFMGKVYEQPFEVELVEKDRIIPMPESSQPIGRHLDGCRIGFDAGGSDIKVSAVVDGEAIFSEEVVWHPKLNANPEYHYSKILSAMKTAAAKMPRVDAIGVSSAGVFVKNRTMAASLFIKVPEDLFEKRVKNIYLDIAREMGNVPIEVANDGDVTALAGSMSLRKNNVLGIAMGTAQAAGYIDEKGNITGWLNELSFVPVDFSIDAVVDEWSGDHGIGSKYFSQDAVIRLAGNAGISLDPSSSPAEKLVEVQKLVEDGDKIALEIFKTIGIYLGYSLAFYDLFYDMKNVLVLGRVTSGKGGTKIVEYAKKVLRSEFSGLYRRIRITLPDERSRRVGQSIAAASLPKALNE